jgi:hypothetical protein
MQKVELTIIIGENAFYLAYICILIILFYEYKLLLKTEDLFRS